MYNFFFLGARENYFHFKNLYSDSISDFRNVFYFKLY